MFLAAAGAPVRCEWRTPLSEPRRVRGNHPEDRTDSGRHPGRRPPDRGIARRVGHPRARRCRWPTSTTATSCCCVRACRTSRRSHRSSTGRTRDTRGCCSWAAAAPSCSRRDGTSGRSPASDSRCRSTRPADTTLSADGAAEGVRLQPLRVRAAVAPALRTDRDRRRHRGRPARPAIPRQGNGQRALVPMDA